MRFRIAKTIRKTRMAPMANMEALSSRKGSVRL
jgi:hypothetical protein